ncbi:MAG: polymer-forming cytoskeletal protein [Chloroflexi bacterium]|nr:polymer-forming cytoskeletal protein [Chloroflexota bacterium]
MFSRKSDDQEWSRFRGALARDRDREDAPQSTAAAEAPDPPHATPAAPPPNMVVAPQSFAPITRGAPEPQMGPTQRPRQGGMPGVDGDVETLIGERTSFEGTLKAAGSIRILGTVQGEIESKGAVIVDERATVKAKVTASQVIVAGLVDGQIQCDGRVEIRPSGRVKGEIQAGALIVQEGAYFDGSSHMQEPPSPQALRA